METNIEVQVLGERRIFYIDIGDIPEIEILQHIKDIMNSTETI